RQVVEGADVTAAEVDAPGEPAGADLGRFGEGAEQGAQVHAEKADLAVHAGAVSPGDARPALGPAVGHLGAGLLHLDLAAAASRAEGEVHGQPPFTHLHAEHRPAVQNDVAAAGPLPAERPAQAQVHGPLDALRQVGPGGEEAGGLDVVE